MTRRPKSCNINSSQRSTTRQRIPSTMATITQLQIFSKKLKNLLKSSDSFVCSTFCQTNPSSENSSANEKNVAMTIRSKRSGTPSSQELSLDTIASSPLGANSNGTPNYGKFADSTHSGRTTRFRLLRFTAGSSRNYMKIEK